MDVDGAHGERKATESLIAAGHRRIAFLGWPEDSDVGEDRKAGWEQACSAAGVATDGLCERLEDDLAQGRASCARLLDAPAPPTAFVCVSDTIALGAWTEITARGLDPGRDVAVIGFDDSTAAAAVGLTSVAQPLDEVADACLVALDRLLSPGSSAGKRGARPRVLLEPQPRYPQFLTIPREEDIMRSKMAIAAVAAAGLALFATACSSGGNGFSSPSSSSSASATSNKSPLTLMFGSSGLRGDGRGPGRRRRRTPSRAASRCR